MEIQQYNPNLSEIAEQVLLGPQADIIEKISNINLRYGTNLRATKTFRWAPGTGEQLKKAYANAILDWNKKYSGVYHFFNRVDNKKWHHNSFRDSLNRVNTCMTHLRDQGVTFQDNTELVVEAFNVLKNKAIEELETIKNIYPETEIDCRLDVIEHENPANNKFVFKCLITNPIMSVYNDDCEFAAIKLYPTEIIYEISMIKVVNAQSSDNFTRLAHSQVKGKYHSPSDTLYHPYLQHRWNRSGTDEHAVCLGSMTGDITSAISRFNFVAAVELLSMWICRYHVTQTHPHNKPPTSYFGLPKYIKDQENSALYLNAFPHESSNCGIPDAIGKLPYGDERELSIIMDNTCNSIECELRNICDYYNNVVNVTEERLNNLIKWHPLTDYPYNLAYEYYKYTDIGVMQEVQDSLNGENNATTCPHGVHITEDEPLCDDCLDEQVDEFEAMTDEERALNWVQRTIERRS
tara:strand:- start:28542 stop:29933 length:1392 start_codon:yes stop_codon:yes gene_type:complete